MIVAMVSRTGQEAVYGHELLTSGRTRACPQAAAVWLFRQRPPLSTGTGDPPLKSDPGAGPWNSRAKTAGAIAQHAGLLGVVMHGAPNLYPG